MSRKLCGKAMENFRAENLPAGKVGMVMSAAEIYELSGLNTLFGGVNP